MHSARFPAGIDLMSNSERCPADPEETAEAHLLGNLSPDEARTFEKHCGNCSSCAAILAYVVAMKQAEQRLRDSER